jgi:predicted nucleotidyltransferase
MGAQNLPRKARGIADAFVKGLEKIYGDGLVSAVVYGSAAGGEYSGKYSNINFAVVLKDTSLGSLKKASRLIRKIKFSSVIPVFFTERYISTSTDIFPLEFLDMKENHIVLRGKDPFAKLEIDARNLRFQCEQELKSKILNIKRAYVRTAGSAALEALLLRSLTSSLHVLRNLAGLKGRERPYGKEDVIEGVSREFGVDLGGMKKALDMRSGNMRLTRAETEDCLASLVKALEEISDRVDALQR